MEAVSKCLPEVEEAAEAAAVRTARWAAVNSWSRHTGGLARLCALLREEFGRLGGEVREVALPPMEAVDRSGGLVAVPLGRGLWVRRRPEVPSRVLLVGHMDTVFPPGHAFREPVREGEYLRGPGVADAKGGLAVLLAALEALEASPWAQRLGWEVWVAPDEEVGSPGSSGFLLEAAARCRVGLVFEPGFPDGALVSGRKGVGSYAAVVRGRSAHAGRNPHDGRNAVHALARFVVDLVAIDRQGEGVSVNVGQVEGGEAVNIVPDLAIGRFGVRLPSPADRARFEDHLARATAAASRQDGIGFELHGGVTRPPWGSGPAERRLLGLLAACGRELGYDIRWRPSGGASDANLLSAAGLPVLDGLGPWGEGLHTAEERIPLRSLGERVRLISAFLLGLASGEVSLEGPGEEREEVP